MKKLKALSIAAVILIIGNISYAQNHRNETQKEPPKFLSANEIALEMSREMKTELGLTDKQYKKILPLNLKEAKLIEAKEKQMAGAKRPQKTDAERSQGNENFSEGSNMESQGSMQGRGVPSGGGNGGGMRGGMRGGPGGPGAAPGGNVGAQPSQETTYSEELHEKVKAKNDAKLKKILTASQYEKWRKIQIDKIRREFEQL